MNKYLKKSLILSVGALLSASALATDYTYTTTGGVEYTYTLDTATFSNTAVTLTETPSITEYALRNISGTGALRITGTVDADLSGAFTNNSTTTYAQSAGAVFLSGAGYVKSLDGFFGGNTSSSGTSGTGGAICLNASGASIGTLTGTFVENVSSLNGGAISSKGTITTIGDTTDTDTYSTSFDYNSSVSGGAIYNTGTITDIYASFTSNSATNGAAIYNEMDSSTSGAVGYIENIYGTFTDNTASTNGGAIYNSATIGTIYGTFTNNAASNQGGVILNSGTISSLSGTFTGNTAGASGGVVYNTGTISSLSGTFTGNTATNNYGGVIFNTSSGSIYIDATSSDTVFTGNKDSTYDTNGYVAIANNGTIYFNSSNGYSVILNDSIIRSNDSTTPSLTIQSGTTVFNNTVLGQDITVNSGATLTLGSYENSSASLSSSSLTVSEDAVLNILASNSTSDDSTGGTVTVSSSSFTLNTGSSIFFSAYSNLTLESSTVSIDDLASVIIDLSGCDIGDYSYTLIYTDSSTISNEIYEALKNEDIEVITSTNIVASDINLELDSIGTNLILSVVLSSAAVPEPSTYAMIFGVVALGFAAYRRRK